MSVHAFFFARESAEFAADHLARIIDLPAKAVRIRRLDVVDASAAGMTEMSVNLPPEQEDLASEALSDVGAWTVTRH